MKEAMFYESFNGKIRCLLCNHMCTIKDGARGICGVRENHEGKLYSLVYGKCVAAGIDPIEKKPLFHFYPGTKAYSVATVGCNFRCLNCQNWDISQMPKDKEGKIIGDQVTPEEIVANVKRFGCQTIAYTYTEPTIFYEYAYDTARLAHKEGIKNVFVTNGYMSDETIRLIVPYLDAANVDLKFFRDESYRNRCSARLEPVLETIKKLKDNGVWLEITTLIIPGPNDSSEELSEIAEFSSIP